MNLTNTFTSSDYLSNSEVQIMAESNSFSRRSINFFPLVLIVEDDEDTRLMLKYLLKIWDYRIVEATDGEQAVQSAEIHQPDLIVISGRLQKIDELTATRRIRELPMLAETGIIFISGYSGQTVRASALAAGADDFLIKPIDFGQLEKSLENCLRKNYRQSNSFVGGVL